jgi:hypothetical protein
MFATLILAVSIAGQATAYDGPTRQWLQGDIAGRTVWIWGWRDVSGGVRYFPQENHDLYPQYKPRSPAKKAVVVGPGMVIESNGTLNNGLNLSQSQQTRHSGFDTNDPGLLNKIKLDGDTTEAAAEKPCPAPGPDDEPDFPDIASPTFDLEAWLKANWGAVAFGVGVLVLILFALSRPEPHPSSPSPP